MGREKEGKESISGTEWLAIITFGIIVVLGGITVAPGGWSAVFSSLIRTIGHR